MLDISLKIAIIPVSLYNQGRYMIENEKKKRKKENYHLTRGIMQKAKTKLSETTV